jgi:hypothetical protein
MVYASFVRYYRDVQAVYVLRGIFIEAVDYIHLGFVDCYTAEQYILSFEKANLTK